MKKDKIVFWITTGLFSLMMLSSAFMYLTAWNGGNVQPPGFFRVISGLNWQ
ncbi:hypothetical protein [Niabella ginsenosidivorans]|uniref:hypothetical protein n=1 Tax=Niabella ginsenosidivorans TaxID=1176587 RepID=UPI001FE07983|nr:hypothetical protein [Niabella ginsenosidivorans]